MGGSRKMNCKCKGPGARWNLESSRNMKKPEWLLNVCESEDFGFYSKCNGMPF